MAKKKFHANYLELWKANDVDPTDPQILKYWYEYWSRCDSASIARAVCGLIEQVCLDHAIDMTGWDMGRRDRLQKDRLVK